MPVTDASQFTRMKKLQAAQARVPGISNKMTTHLSQPFYSATGLSVFLPSASGKMSSVVTFNRINVSLGRYAKVKTPGGNLFGEVRELPSTLDGGTASTTGGIVYDGGSAAAAGGTVYSGGGV